MAVKLKYSMKVIAITNIYRLPITLSNSSKCSLTQYNKIDRKTKTTNKYRKEIFLNIKQYLKDNNDIDDIIIAGDFNQYIEANEI